MDKAAFVIPLVEELKAGGLTVWYDNISINLGESIKHEIQKGIENCLVFVMVISDAFLRSSWTSVELGMTLAQKNDVRFLPILYNVGSDSVTKKFPFLLDLKYLSTSGDASEVSRQICDLVNSVREESGFLDTRKTDLLELVKNMHRYNSFKLDQIAVKMRNVVKELSSDIVTSLNTISLILDMILSDVAVTENIYVGGVIDILAIIEESKILNNNVLEHFKYLNKIRNEYITAYARLQPYTRKQDIYLIEVSVYSILSWYMSTYFRHPVVDNYGLVAVSPSEISFDDMVEANTIEKLVFPPELIAGSNMTKLWYDHNNFTLLGVRDKATEKLIGFFHTLPVSEELFNRISSGNFDDTTFLPDDIRQYDIPGFYKLYISSVCVHPQYNSSAAFKLMYDQFIEMLIFLARDNEIYISEIIADGVTPKGKMLCESIGMTKHCISVHNTPVYRAQLIPPALSSLRLLNRQGHQLLDYYQRVYEEYKEFF